MRSRSLLGIGIVALLAGAGLFWGGMRYGYAQASHQSKVAVQQRAGFQRGYGYGGGFPRRRGGSGGSVSPGPAATDQQ